MVKYDGTGFYKTETRFNNPIPGEMGSTDEQHRIRGQNSLLRSYDKPVYDQLFLGKRDLSVLDVGCGSGAQVMTQLEPRSEIKDILAIDKDAKAILDAKRINEDSSKVTWKHCSCDSGMMPVILEDYLAEIQKDAFDLINISMLFLHIADPESVLKTLYSFLAPGGMIFIRDIDDRLSMVYPDKNGLFGKMIDMADICETMGYRKSGREIPTMLIHAGYEDIRMWGQGVTTCGMDRYQRTNMFDIFFRLVAREMKTVASIYPDDKDLARDSQWANDNLDRMEKEFLNDDVFCQIGFVIFTARKPVKRPQSLIDSSITHEQVQRVVSSAIDSYASDASADVELTMVEYHRENVSELVDELEGVAQAAPHPQAKRIASEVPAAVTRKRDEAPKAQPATSKIAAIESAPPIVAVPQPVAQPASQQAVQPVQTSQQPVQKESSAPARRTQQKPVARCQVFRVKRNPTPGSPSNGGLLSK